MYSTCGVGSAVELQVDRDCGSYQLLEECLQRSGCQETPAVIDEPASKLNKHHNFIGTITRKPSIEAGEMQYAITLEMKYKRLRYSHRLLRPPFCLPSWNL